MHRSPLVLILASLRLTRVGIHIFGALALVSVYPSLRPLMQRRLLRWWSQGLLRVLNVHHVTNGPQLLINDAACLYVANHISWLDIFAVNVTTPARFVAKSEVSQWPVLGWLVQRSGTLFVRRAVRSDAVRVNALVTLMATPNCSTYGHPNCSTLIGQIVYFWSAWFCLPRMAISP